ncbi:hypothetical protein AM587_10016568 [Phytophthora nicotianae]|uniref:DUF3752 domain-containing protein n=1 Tax=Phytophthora nicotianae TaxID=4792 RepID=A0A0W8BVD2_PHYNI|nr:hypothetical protein AM587_10016568 [Phytophthora nicotianae]
MGKHERDSSRLDERKRHKRRRDEDKKKKHKKHKDKERKSHRRHKRSCHSSGSDSDSDSDRVPVADYMRAMKVVRELLTETPGLASDLLGLLQMVDDGEVAVVGGIENRRIRSKLKELFPLLGLVKVGGMSWSKETLREPKGAFAKPLKAKDKGECLMEVFQRMLSGGSEKDLPQPATKREQGDSLTMEDADPVEEKPAVQKPIKRDLPIGPALPPASGFRLADEHVEAEMIRKAEQLEKEQWERTRDGGKDKEGKEAPAVREAWMTMMPESSILKDSLGPQNRPPGKPAAFRSKEPARVDKTWFDSPEERERAKRAKLDVYQNLLLTTPYCEATSVAVYRELIGYVREENAPSTAAASSMPATMGQPTVNESILPNANPEADEEMRKQMENLRKSRGPSLLEQHQRKQAEHAKIGVGSTQSVGGWNRDRDLAVRRGMSGDDAERMISAAKQINSKFTAPTISRQFL